jgi:fucose permease
VPRRSIAPYLVGFAVIGISLSTAGPAIDHLKSRTGVGDSAISWVFVGASGGYIIGSLLGGRLLDRGAGHRMWPACIALIALGVAGASTMTTVVEVAACFGVIGLASGAADVAGNTLVIWSRPDGASRDLNMLHLCFALGAISAPIAVNRALVWTDRLWPVALLVVVVGAYPGLQMMATDGPMPVAMNADDRAGRLPPARRSVLVAAGAFFAAYVAMEAGFSGWIHEYTLRVGYGTENTATQVIVAFWVGFAMGRMAGVAIADRVAPGSMVSWAMVATVVVAGVFVVVPNGGATLFAVTLLLGIATAPQYASMVAYVESHGRLSGAATSIFVVASGFGGLAYPRLIGELFDRHGEGVLPWATLAGAVATSAAAGLVGLAVAGQRPPVTSMNVPVT